MNPFPFLGGLRGSNSKANWQRTTERGEKSRPFVWREEGLRCDIGFKEGGGTSGAREGVLWSGRRAMALLEGATLACSNEALGTASFISARVH